MKKHLRVSIIICISLFALLILSILLHNFISGLIGFEEPVFFIVAIISGILFPLSAVYLIIIAIISLLRR